MNPLISCVRSHAATSEEMTVTGEGEGEGKRKRNESEQSIDPGRKNLRSNNKRTTEKRTDCSQLGLLHKLGSGRGRLGRREGGEAAHPGERREEES